MSRLFAAAALTAALVGCSKPAPTPTPPAPEPPAAPKSDPVADERAKLSPEDRRLVDEQEWCAVSTRSRLGSMGPPLKVDVGGKPVFICCDHCEAKAKADPAKTHEAVARLREKAKAGRDGKSGS